MNNIFNIHTKATIAKGNQLPSDAKILIIS